MTVRIYRASVQRWTLVFLALVLLAPCASLAQTRSDTGRHKPAPPAAAEDSTTTARVQGAGTQVRRWHLGISGGVQGGSDLFRVKVVDGPAVPWSPATGGGFQSARFKASLDRNFSFGLFLVRDLSSIWSVRADMGYSRMDVAAEALLGQYGAVFLFDRFSVFNLGLGVEARLVQVESYPFVQASVLVSHLGPSRATGLEQTNWGARLGLGYLHSLQELWALRFEARLSYTGFSVGDYVPIADSYEQPEIEYQVEDHLGFFEFLLAIQVNM